MEWTSRYINRILRKRAQQTVQIKQRCSSFFLSKLLVKMGVHLLVSLRRRKIQSGFIIDKINYVVEKVDTTRVEVVVSQLPVKYS